MTDGKDVAPVLGWDQPPSMDGPPPAPDPEHNRRILKEKRFEILAVMGFIILGTGFLMWRGVRPTIVMEGPDTFGEAVELVQYSGYAKEGTTDLFGRTVVTFGAPIEGFVLSIDLFGTGDDVPLETAILWLEPNPDEWPPSEEEYQKAVNAVADVGVRLVSHSNEAIQKAIDTSVFERDAERPHDKGVAATQDGWKITYLVFKEFDETAEPAPALTLVLQSIEAASDPGLAALNRTLYRAAEAGEEVKAALAAAEEPDAR